MKIALAQMNPVTGDIKGNTEKIKREIAKVKGKAEIIVFPEMAISGYCISDLVEDELFIERNKEALKEIAVLTDDIAVVVGFIDYDRTKKNNDGRTRKYNAAAVIYQGKIAGVTYKTLLPNYRYFDDKRYFTSAEERRPIPLNIDDRIILLGVSICEDMWDDDYDIKPVKELGHKGADIIININASPFIPGKIGTRERIIKKHIADTGLPFVYVNTVGAADNGKNIIPFDGQSLAYNKYGELIGLGNQFIEDLFIVDTETRKEIVKEKFDREKELFEALVMSVKDYGAQTGFNKAILPLSGGIDSALGLIVAVEAFGKENVITYNLPSKYNTDTTKGIAKAIAKNIGVEYKVIPIQEIDDTIKTVFTKNAHEVKDKVARENLHARIRGILMMLESNDTKALLISNGNKTEIALGYSTLYGDMCGGISVIGDLSKMEVYKLCRYVNTRYKKEIIPEETFTIKPSAELSEGQYDPFDYEVVAPLVDLFIEKRYNPVDLIEKFKKRELNELGYDVYKKYTLEGFEKLVYEMYKLLKRSVYKRLQGPPIIAVTQRAFGFDLRETLINRWEGK